eukprot:g2510.t1
MELTEDMTKILVQVWEDRDKPGSEDYFETYGTFVATIMVLQTVYQAKGFAELPDVLAALEPFRADPAYAEAREALDAQFAVIGFEQPPVFSAESMARGQLVALMEKLLEAARDVEAAVKRPDEVFDRVNVLANQVIDEGCTVAGVESLRQEVAESCSKQMEYFLTHGLDQSSSREESAQAIDMFIQQYSLNRMVQVRGGQGVGRGG